MSSTSVLSELVLPGDRIMEIDCCTCLCVNGLLVIGMYNIDDEDVSRMNKTDIVAVMTRKFEFKRELVQE